MENKGKSNVSSSVGRSHRRRRDDTSQFRDRMLNRPKRKKMLERALFWTLVVICFFVMCLLVFAYVVDK